MEHPARLAAARSRDAAIRKAKDEWLALYAEDAVVEDPVGPSTFDPDGQGHRGQAALAEFWDKTIGMAQRLEFDIRESYAAGDEVANVGRITAFLPGGLRADTDGVYVYRVDADGLIVSMRAFWEIEQTMATLRQA